MTISTIKISEAYGNPNQPRKRFDQDQLEDLAASIKENGLIQPISVVKDSEGRYMIVAGERRFRAHMILLERGLIEDAIPAIISDLDDAQLAINAIVENDNRVDVTLMEQARSYKRMIDVHGFTVEGLAKKLGKRLHKVEETLTFNNLTEQYQAMLDRGQLYLTQAAALATLSARGQDLLFKQINSGQCRTVTALKAIAQTIADAEAQTSMFGEGGPIRDDAPMASVTDINAARGFEAKVESLAAFLRQGIDGNVVTAVKKVNPGRAGTVAELLAQMQKDLHRMESAFRVAAVQEELTGAVA